MRRLLGTCTGTLGTHGTLDVLLHHAPGRPRALTAPSRRRARARFAVRSASLWYPRVLRQLAVPALSLPLRSIRSRTTRCRPRLRAARYGGRVRCLSARSGCDRFVDDAQQLADLDVLALLPRDAGEDAAFLGVHLEVDLLGFELDERLANLDAVAFLLQPARDAGLDDRFTKFRNDDIGHRENSKCEMQDAN